MKLHINGEERVFAGTHWTPISLIKELGLEGRRVAVEVNARIVPRAEHDHHAFCDGDNIEIVHFVGGGA